MSNEGFKCKYCGNEIYGLDKNGRCPFCRNLLKGHTLTQKDLDDMQKEMDYRRIELRPQLLDHVKEARALGDLSENFEYYAAKKAKNENESRIRYLEKMIKNSFVVEDKAGEDEVGINKTVTIYVEEDDVEESYKIVTTVREDTLHGLISNESPLGKTLMGHKVGDRIEVVVNPNYSYFAVIRKIDNSTTDDSGELRKF